jgi:hypothetical protein
MTEEHTMEVRRVEGNDNPKYNYEFELLVDGEVIMTAGELESLGYKFSQVPNWTTALKRYGEAYIHGLEADK